MHKTYSLGFLGGGFIRKRVEGWTANIDYDKTLPKVAKEEGGKMIVATATLSFSKNRPALKHKAGFGITVHDKYQDRGLGTLLTEYMLDIAKKPKLRKISLGMRVDNARAIRIYEKCGVKIEATLKDEHFTDGKHYADHIMSIFL